LVSIPPPSFFFFSLSGAPLPCQNRKIHQKGQKKKKKEEKNNKTEPEYLKCKGSPSFRLWPENGQGRRKMKINSNGHFSLAGKKVLTSILPFR